MNFCKILQFAILLFCTADLFCGIEYRCAKIILEEHKYRPITGTVLLIGRQSVDLTPNQAISLVQSEGIAIRENASIEKNPLGMITDRSFFSLFSDTKVIALDISPYEGAELIADLNLPIDDKYANMADFIYNGSCMDNIFDSATVLRNLSRLAKVGGRIMNVEHGSPIQGAYIMFSPHYFFDYYAINRFSDFRAYTFLFELFNDPWDVCLWEPYYKDHNNQWHISSCMNHNWRNIIIIMIAEKGSDSTWEMSPIQGHYRQAHGTDLDVYFQTFQRSNASERPLPSIPTYNIQLTPVPGFTYLGRIQRP